MSGPASGDEVLSRVVAHPTDRVVRALELAHRASALTALWPALVELAGPPNRLQRCEAIPTGHPVFRARKSQCGTTGETQAGPLL
jgi:hypothetical protein